MQSGGSARADCRLCCVGSRARRSGGGPSPARHRHLSRPSATASPACWCGWEWSGATPPATPSSGWSRSSAAHHRLPDRAAVPIPTVAWTAGAAFTVSIFVLIAIRGCPGAVHHLPAVRPDHRAAAGTRRAWPARHREVVPWQTMPTSEVLAREGWTSTFADRRYAADTGFTREFGDQAASGVAARFAAIVRDTVPSFDGELLELRGDEAMCVFSSARQALRAAVEVQRRRRTRARRGRRSRSLLASVFMLVRRCPPGRVSGERPESGWEAVQRCRRGDLPPSVWSGSAARFRAIGIARDRFG